VQGKFKRRKHRRNPWRKSKSIRSGKKNRSGEKVRGTKGRALGKRQEEPGKGLRKKTDCGTSLPRRAREKEGRNATLKRDRGGEDLGILHI